jgi:hypothetical protein
MIFFWFSPLSCLWDILEEKLKMHCGNGGDVVANVDASIILQPIMSKREDIRMDCGVKINRIKTWISQTYCWSVFWVLPQHALNNLFPVAWNSSIIY